VLTEVAYRCLLAGRFRPTLRSADMLTQHKRFSSWAALTLALCSAIPASATTVYMINTAEQFGTINLSTGAFTSLGTTEVGLTPELLQGLGETGGVLYGAGGANDDTLYSINTANGALTSIGTSGISYAGFGSTLTGLFGLSTTGNLYSVNPSNGATTEIGPNVTIGGTLALSTGSSTLFLAEFFNGAFNLYTLNTTTGAATLVGPTGGIPIGALLWDGSSTLYGGQDSPAPLFVDTLSTVNGSVTTGPALTGSTTNFGGFAPLLTSSATPEPGTWSLLGAGIAILAFVKQRRKISSSVRPVAGFSTAAE
jgi:hypothetical protein